MNSFHFLVEIQNKLKTQADTMPLVASTVIIAYCLTVSLCKRRIWNCISVL